MQGAVYQEYWDMQVFVLLVCKSTGIDHGGLTSLSFLTGTWYLVPGTHPSNVPVHARAMRSSVFPVTLISFAAARRFDRQGCASCSFKHNSPKYCVFIVNGIAGVAFCSNRIKTQI